MSREKRNATTSDGEQFILFELAGETYGVRLLDVREVVETMQLTPVANAVKEFRGVCNLRGQIVGVIDLKMRFAMAGEPNPRSVYFVFETDVGTIAAQVDRVISVSEIANADIDRRPSVVSKIPINYVLGIGKHQDRLVTLMDLKKILTKEELVAVGDSVADTAA